MLFPSYEEWVETVLNPMDRKNGRGPYRFETPEWHQNYYSKFRIAQAFKPKTIIEVGVRYGYSAHAFLCACPEARYIGIDADLPSLNSMGEPTCDWAFAMLRRTIPGNPRLELIKVDTQKVGVTTLIPVAEFVHIDANHSYQGATADMEAVWPRCTQAMLVDDYVGTASVHDAVDAFVTRHNAGLLTMQSKNGEALIIPC
jgi:cephalosporin hydroxylase